MADAHKTATTAAVHAGAAVVESIAEKSESWAIKMLGVGLGIFTGSLSTNLKSQFSKSDEHFFHRLMTRLRNEDAVKKTDEAATLLFFLEKTFPNPGIGFDQIINVFQNNFRSYVTNHATVTKSGEDKAVYNEDLAIAFLREEIINPIRNAPKGKNTGYKQVIRNFTALDMSMPPKDIDKIAKNYVKAIHVRAEAARAAPRNFIHRFWDKTGII